MAPIGLGIGLAFALGLAASPARALLLGGVEVPKEKVVVYLLIGHSNMCGMDRMNSDGTPHPRGWNYQWGSTLTWVPARETPGLARNGLSGRGSGGPGMPFLKALAAAHPDHHIGVVTNASLSSTCRGENTGGNGSGIDPEDNRYWKGARLYVEIVAAAKAVQAQVTLGGILCMLGSVEATRTSEAVCRNFSADIAQLAQDLRADLGAPNLPFLMGEYEAGATGDFAPNLPLPTLIAQQIRQLPSRLPFSATVDSRGIAMFDDHHYSAKSGQVEFARRAVDTLHAKQWFPPPSGVGLAVLPARGARPRAAVARLALSGHGPALMARDGRRFQANGQFHNLERQHALLHP